MFGSVLRPPDASVPLYDHMVVNKQLDKVMQGVMMWEEELKINPSGLITRDGLYEIIAERVNEYHKYNYLWDTQNPY